MENGIYSLAAYNHANKYGAPALARWIAQYNFYQCKINGDMVNRAKWARRQVNALNKQWAANDLLLCRDAN